MYLQGFCKGELHDLSTNQPIRMCFQGIGEETENDHKKKEIRDILGFVEGSA
jgi:hypothetical protein